MYTNDQVRILRTCGLEEKNPDNPTFEVIQGKNLNLTPT
jgi:hypothetical protein